VVLLLLLPVPACPRTCSTTTTRPLHLSSSCTEPCISLVYRRRYP